MLTGDMLARSARRFPRKMALADGARALTYAEFDAAANRFARFVLEELGLAKGEKLAILCSNRVEYGVAFFGAARSGAVLVAVSTMYANADLKFVLARSDAVALVYEEQFAATVARVRGDLPNIRAYVEIEAGGAQEGAFLQRLEGFDPSPCGVALRESDPFCINFTGGTTGNPKGALTTHRAREITAHTAVVEHGFDERDRILIVTPMFHIAGLNLTFQAAVLIGASVVLVPKWSVSALCELIPQHGITALFLVPTQILALLAEPGVSGESLPSWRKLIVGGSPIPDKAQLEMRERFPAVQIVQIYGQTEMGIITSVSPWHLPEKLGACGRQVFNVEVAVVDPQGRPVQPGEIGEVVARGESLMLGYYNDEEQTRMFYKHGDGWGWTGDVAKMDADGFITLVDRSTDLIISGGVNIYPKEIENTLYKHPGIMECAVFGIPDEKWGEVPAALIRTRPGHVLDEAGVLQFFLDQSSPFKRPKLVEFVDDFPRTPVGKIQKNLLRKQYAQAVAA